jgi:hypothetical protein
LLKLFKNATEGTIPTPASTSVPTSGKAIKAGISVIVPNKADAIVAIAVDCFSTKDAKSAGGSIVRINPIAKMIVKYTYSHSFSHIKCHFKCLICLSLILAKKLQEKLKFQSICRL